MPAIRDQFCFQTFSPKCLTLETNGEKDDKVSSLGSLSTMKSKTASKHKKIEMKPCNDFAFASRILREIVLCDYGMMLW